MNATTLPLYASYTPASDTTELIGVPKPAVPGAPIVPTAEITFPWGLPELPRRAGRARAFRTGTQRVWSTVRVVAGLIGIVLAAYVFLMATKPLGQLLLILADGRQF